MGDRARPDPPRSGDDDEIIPLADPTLTCEACGRSFVPVSGEAICPQCVHVYAPHAATDEVEDDDRVCRECGYSMRGLRRGSTCPECGRGAERERTVRAGFRTPTSDVSLPPRPVRPSAEPAQPARPRGRRARPPADDLLARGAAASAALTSLALGALACAIVAGLLAIGHWWAPGAFGDRATAYGWGLFTLAGILLTLPGSVPAGRVPRWLSTITIAGGILATVSLGMPSAVTGVAGVASRAAFDLLTIVGALSFMIGLIGRLNAIVEFTGQDPADRGFLSSSGPFLTGVFIVSSGFLLTWFFRRKLDFADAFALAVTVWLVWRLAEILWFAKDAVRTRRELADRQSRQRDDVANARATGEDPETVCAKCGYTLRGLPGNARCPECGSLKRSR